MSSPDDALELLARTSQQAGPCLTAYELISDVIVGFALKHVPEAVRPLASDHPWYVMMEISSGNSSEHARQLIEEILAQSYEDGLVRDAAVTSSIAQFQAIWHLRDTMSEAQKPEGFSIKHDISVPVVAIPAFIETAGRAVLDIEPEARIVCFGHMGDGNLHYNISEPVGGDSKAFAARYRQVNNAVHEVVRALGGSISAEHGIGQLKRDELLATEPPVAIELMRQIKQIIDPSGIMNPGKLI